jgi:SSS family transporter
VEQIRVPWSGVDTFIFFLYFLIVVAVGLRFTKRASKGMGEYFLSGRSLTIPLLVGTMMASWYDGFSVVGVAEWAWAEGIAAMIVYVIPVTLTRIPFALWIAPLVRGKLPEDVMTVPDLLEYLYDKRVKFLGALTILAGVLYNGANFLVISQLMHLIFGISQFTAILISGITVGIYVTASGLWAVAVTDVVQMAYMTIAAGLAVVPALKLAGGFEGLYASLASSAPHLFQATGGLTSPEIIAWALVGMSIYTSPIMYQRFSAAESAQSAKISFLICMPIWLVFSSIMVLLGLCSRALHPSLDPYQGFWMVVMTVLPVGIRAIFAAGLVAAVMSTLDSDLLIHSTAMVKDIYAGFINPRVSDRAMVNLNRMAIVTLIVLTMISTQLWHGGIMKAWYYVSGFLVAGLFVPLVFGLFYKKKTPAAGLTALLVGVVGYVLWEFVWATPFGLPAYDVVWVVSGVVYLLVCELTYKTASKEGARSGV